MISRQVWRPEHFRNFLLSKNQEDGGEDVARVEKMSQEQEMLPRSWFPNHTNCSGAERGTHSIYQQGVWERQADLSDAPEGAQSRPPQDVSPGPPQDVLPEDYLELKALQPLKLKKCFCLSKNLNPGLPPNEVLSGIKFHVLSVCQGEHLITEHLLFSSSRASPSSPLKPQAPLPFGSRWHMYLILPVCLGTSCVWGGGGESRMYEMK